MSAAPNIWRDRSAWPARDGPGYVFLGRAVETVARHMYGDAWTGLEGATTPSRALHETPNEGDRLLAAITAERIATPGASDEALLAQAMQRAWQIPATPAALRVTTIAGGLSITDRKPRGAAIASWPSTPPRAAPLPDPDEWAVLVAADRARRAPADAAVSRWLGVINALTDALIKGEIQYGLRSPYGRLTAGEAWSWASDDWRSHFLTGRMNRPWSGSDPITGEALVSCWIFCEADSFAKWLATVPATGGSDRPAWWPANLSEPMATWCTSPATDDAARQRIRDAGAEPYEAEICRELAAMALSVPNHARPPRWQTERKKLEGTITASRKTARAKP